MIAVAVALVLVYLLLAGAMWAFQRAIIYQPDTSTPPPAGTVVPGAQDITLHTQDGLELTAWLVPAGPAVDRGFAVLLAPGNAGNRVMRAPFAQLLAARGLTVLLLDYRGYGGNPGSPTEHGTTLDLLAGAAALDDAGFTAARTIYFGESIGGGVVANAHAHLAPAGIVLRSPFTELADVAAAHFGWLPVRLLLRDRYPVIDRLAGSQVPITIVYGAHDTIVPTRLSRQVAAAVPNLVEELVLPGDHNDSVMYGPQVADAVVRLVDALA